jgi:hypothetical protein
MRRPTDPRQQALFDGIELATNAKNWKDRTLVGYEPAIETGVYDDPEGDGNVWERWDEHLAQRYPTDPDTSHLFIDAMELPLADLPKRVEEGGDDAVEPARPPQKERLFNMSTGLPTSAPSAPKWTRVKDGEYELGDGTFNVTSGEYEYSDDSDDPHESDEFGSYQRMMRNDPGAWFDSKEDMEEHPAMKPHLQGALFGKHVGTMSSQDPSSVNRQMRWDRSQEIATHRGDLEEFDGWRVPGETPDQLRNRDIGPAVARNLYESDVPYRDLKKASDGGVWSTGFGDEEGVDFSAYFHPLPNHMGFRRDTPVRMDTTVHELGHALHYDGGRSSHFRTKGLDNRKGAEPSPVLEGVADGYADRYARRSSDPISKETTGAGYHRTFNLPEKATDERGDLTDISSVTGGMYAAMRQHVRTTGQIPHISEYTKVSDFRNVQGEQFASLRKSAEADLSRRQGEQLELFPRREPLP